MRTCFEDLPNEILIMIFEYLSSPIIIYDCFRKLNYRFNYLLQTIRLNLDIFIEDQQTLTIVNYFSKYCNRLHLDTISPSIKLKNFSQLRSLIIIEPTNEQIYSIQSKILPMLEYLASPASRYIFDCLFGNIDEQWLYLRTCNFYFSHILFIELKWKMNLNLQNLLGITCSRIILSQLLSLLPCLKYLRVDMILNDLSNWNLSIFDRTLRSLRIGFHHFNYDDLFALISSNLHRLYIDIYDEQSKIDYTYLGTRLRLLTNNLKQFNCDYQGLKISLEELKQAHDFFQNIQLISSHSCDIIRLKCQ